MIIHDEFFEIVREVIGRPIPMAHALTITAIEPTDLGPMVRWNGGPKDVRERRPLEGGGTVLGPITGPPLLEGVARFLAARWRTGTPRVSRDWDEHLAKEHSDIFHAGPCSGPGWSWLWQAGAEWIEELGVPDEFRTFDTKEKFGQLRWACQGYDDEKIDEVIDVIEAISAAVCEQCGAPGFMRKGSWVKVACGTHANGKGRHGKS